MHNAKEDCPYHIDCEEDITGYCALFGESLKVSIDYRYSTRHTRCPQCIESFEIKNYSDTNQQLTRREMSLENSETSKEDKYKDNRYEEGMDLLNDLSNNRVLELEEYYFQRRLLLSLSNNYDTAKHELANLYANGEISL